jgi:hypothetical protein
MDAAREETLFCALNKKTRIKGDTSMRHIKNIAVVTLALCLMTGFAQAAKKEEAAKQPTAKQAAAKNEKPDGTLRLSGGSFAVGVGFSWGGGTLTFKGKEYPVSVKGLSLGKLGISGASASGEVYGLKDIRDFDGHYNAASAGLTVAGGRTAVALKNEKGVRIVVSSTTRGFDVTVGTGGVTMKVKK